MKVEIDAREVLKALDDLADRDAKRTMQKATKKAATFLAQKARLAAPRRTGRLRKSVTARAAKRDRPGAYVSARAPHRHLVQLGTDVRRSGSHGGGGRMPANPFISRTADRYGDQALDVAEREIAKALDL